MFYLIDNCSFSCSGQNWDVSNLESEAVLNPKEIWNDTRSIQEQYFNDSRVSKQCFYKCPLCSYSTTRKQNIKRHKLTHTGARPFQCSMCGQRFSMKQSVKRHLIMVHSDAFHIS
ncbi:Zinc finger and BTB domain-containing protein 46, partial [Stegodyphus mimosarum]